MTVLAAGVLCWRIFMGEPQVMVIHRRKHKDMSFPKGKLEDGEVAPVTALRELAEETGMRTVLGPYLGEISYLLPSRHDKLVSYWAARVSNSQVRENRAAFRPNDEVDEVFWLRIPEAKHLLSYSHDVTILEQLEQLIVDNIAVTKAIIVLRHAKAMSRQDWGKSESTRPLVKLGEEQSTALTRVLPSWKIKQVISSPWNRCLQTVSSYASHAGLPISQRPRLTEASYAKSPQSTFELVSRLASDQRPLLLCTHRPVMPGVFGALERLATNVEPGALEPYTHLEPASFVVVQVADDPNSAARLRIASVERHRTLHDD